MIYVLFVKINYHNKILSCFCKGLSVYNIQYKKYYDDIKISEKDLIVTFGMGKNIGIGKIRKKVIKKFHSHICIDKGYIDRNNYFSININGLNGRSENFAEKNDNLRFLKLGIKLGLNINGESVLLCGQVPTDASVLHINYERWLYSTYNKLLKLSKFPILYRPHPKYNKKYNIFGNISNNSLYEDLSKSRYVVSFNSNICLDALIFGVQPICFDEGCIVYDSCHHNLKVINEQPILKQRIQQIYDITYRQYSLKELEIGLFVPKVYNFLC